MLDQLVRAGKLLLHSVYDYTLAGLVGYIVCWIISGSPVAMGF